MECNSCGNEITYVMGASKPRSFGGPPICDDCKNGRGIIGDMAKIMQGIRDKELAPIGMLLPVDNIIVFINNRKVNLSTCKNCCRAIMETGKGYTHWGLNSTRCPDLDDGQDWALLPKAEPNE